MKYYKVSETVLKSLLEDSYTYSALRNGGVDNWEWYGASIGDFIESSCRIDGIEYESIEEIAEEDLENYEEII